MITFSSIVKPEKRSLEIPKQRGSQFIYNVNCGDVVVGRTYGSAFGYIDVYFVNKIARRYNIDSLKKIQKRNLSLDAFVAFGEKIIK
ncbi:MAG: hypothetical protein IKR04_01570 [Clostridia bacterium]|jgi:hypothetical protein|nr:hypothetical protein [Clostridia bacterium]